MESSKKSSAPTPIVAVLRWGHRFERDKRLTAHVALTSRALGASYFFLADIEDKTVEATIKKIVKTWGGTFNLEMGKPWKQTVKDWKAKGGVVVHLTAYGESVESTDVLERIWATQRDVLVIVGSKKVPPDFFSQKISDFNVAIGNQPHSECSSLSIFLDRFYSGRELTLDFKGAKIRIIPQVHGKKTLML